MKIAKQIATTAALTILFMPLFAAEDDGKAFEQFQEILAGIDQKSFEVLQKAVDQTDLSNRVYSQQAVAPEAREIFNNNFRGIVEEIFLQGLPPPDSNAKAKLLQFEFQDGRGQAYIRFSLPRYQYSFQVFDLRHDKRGRLQVVDWFDSTTGEMLSARIAESLLTVMPSKAATRKLLSIKSPSDLQLFQVTELFKAIRDGQAARFFEIYDELGDPLRRQPLIARNATGMAYKLKDMDRFAKALEIFVDVFPDNPDLALMTSDYYMVVQDYGKSFELLERYQQHFAVKEGALPAKLSALALAIGKAEDAEKFAVEATNNEPELELGWWSLLRARAGAKNYQGALEALTHLEDDFGHRLDAAKLRRDKFRAFTRLADSQEFKDWRTTRN